MGLPPVLKGFNEANGALQALLRCPLQRHIFNATEMIFCNLGGINLNIDTVYYSYQ